MNDGILRSGYAPPPMPGSLLGRPVAVEMVDPYGYDADALRYIRAVETADGARLEIGVRAAINAFVVGCKTDGIWDAIKASCILAGARTLAGALVALTGTAPTNFNFASTDYNRKTGLVGNGTTKYLNSNRSNNADPQDSKHLAAFATFVGAANSPFLAAGGFSTGRSFITAGQITISRNAVFSVTQPVAPTFVGASRINSNQVIYRANSTSSAFSSGPSETPTTDSFFVYQRNAAFSTHRLAFYSIGESLNLALLDARVAALINSFGAAI